MADIRELYSETRTDGFDTRIMCQIIKMRGLDKLVLVEQVIRLSAYRAGMGLIEITEKRRVSNS